MNILNKLTIKHLKMNKKRTIVTIIGVILSTALMVGIGLLFSTFREYLIDETIFYNGDYHAEFTNVKKDKLPIITNNIKVKDYFYSEHLGYAYLENGKNEYKPYLNVLAVSDSYFNELKLITGRFPENENEVIISNHIESNGLVSYSVGDTLSLELGERYLDNELVETIGFIEGEKLEFTKTKQYKIVGIVERSIYEDYSEPGYSIFTKDDKENNNLKIYVHYKNISDTYKISEDIANKIGFKNIGGDEYTYYKEVNYNDALLATYGVSKYENIIEGIAGVLAIILGLVSVGCIIVIYNSFAISVMERKKQFGLFSSIGATKKQLRKTVFFEAFVVGTIGIVLGLLSGFLGISVVIKIVNYLIPDTISFKLCAYPLFIIIPIIFMVIVILISAFIPAHKASKITPIEAIRLNDDIKIKGKKLKTNKFVKKIFGIEGDIALKNIKRNKKKYRITIISLFISIVMFITFSSFIDYIFGSVDDVASNPEYDIELYLSNENEFELNINDETINSIVNHEQVDQFIIMKTSNDVFTDSDFSKIYTDEYRNISGFEYDDENELNYINLVVLQDKDFKNYIKDLGYSEEKPILLNIKKGIDYTNNSRKNYDIKRYRQTSLDINLCHENYDEKNNQIISECYSKITNYYLADKMMYGLFYLVRSFEPTIIISDNMKNYYQDSHFNTQIKISAKKYDKLDKMLKFLTEVKNEQIQYINYVEQLKLVHNATLAVKILIYGFIVLVTLIGVTSVFNTINTSIALRRKEFAILRSVGLTPHGFNKILYFESLIFGLKSLFYAIPVSIILVMLIHLSMSNIITFDNLILPIKSMIIAIFAVFIIVIITMMYASSKIKRENILEAIREENI